MKKFKLTKFLKENLKTIYAIIITILLVGGSTTFASYNYFAKNIEYIKKDGTKINIEEALNELYSNNENIILSINQRVYLNTNYTSTTKPNYYNKLVISYDETNNTYTFLKDLSGKIYICQGWLLKKTGSKISIKLNDNYIIQDHQIDEYTSSAFDYEYDFKKGDILKIFSRYDGNYNYAVPIAVDMIKK